MRLHALNGDRARALRAYHVCATVLQRELEVEPSPATREAYERLLNLEVKPQPETGSLAPVVPLVGRDREWAKLQASWRRAQRGQPHLVLLHGEADHRHALVSMGDVVAYAVAAVDNPAAVDQYLAIGGPEALTWRDVVAQTGQVLVQEIPVQFVAIGEPIPGMNETVQPLMWGFETYETVLGMTGTAQTFGVEPTPLEVIAARIFGGASA